MVGGEGKVPGPNGDLAPSYGWWPGLLTSPLEVGKGPTIHRAGLGAALL